MDLSIQAEPLTQEICCAVANNDHFSLPNAPVYLLLSVDWQIHRLFDYGLDLSIQAEPLTQAIYWAIGNNNHFSLPNAPAYLLLTVD